MKTIFYGLMASALMLTAPAALAQSSDQNQNQTQGSGDSQSLTMGQDFVMKAAASDQFEIEAGQLAQQQANDKDIQKFGKKLVTDHSKSSDELMAIVQKAGINATPAEKLDSRHQAMLDQLKSANGKDFDRLFTQFQVQAHEEGIALFSTYAEKGDNDALKQFAQKGLPVLKEHLKMAQSMKTAAN